MNLLSKVEVSTEFCFLENQVTIQHNQYASDKFLYYQYDLNLQTASLPLASPEELVNYVVSLLSVFYHLYPDKLMLTNLPLESHSIYQYQEWLNQIPSQYYDDTSNKQIH